MINGLHTFKFTAVAEVVPTEINLSTEELMFRFEDGSLEPSVTKTVTLTNPGTFPAEFAWEHPQGVKGKPAFVPSPMQGEVPPRKSLQVQVTFTPYLGAHAEHALTLVARGGASKTLYCKADVQEARVVAVERKIDFATVAVGCPKEKMLHLKNVGPSPAVFTFAQPPAGVIVKPARGSVGVGMTQEISLELTAAKSQIMETSLVAEVRCGKAVKIALAAEAVVPEVAVVQDEIDFGGLVVGAASKQPLTLTNRSAVAALVWCDLTEQPEFEMLLFKAGGDEDGAGGAQTDGTTTVAGDVDEDELPLQLITSSPRGISGLDEPVAPVAQPSDAAAAAADDGAPPPTAPEQRLYRIMVPAGGELALQLSYEPKTEREVHFELPLKLAGVASAPQLRRAVVGEGLRPRLLLSQTVVKMGEKIVRDAKFPYTHELSLTSADDQPLEWELDTAPECDASPFKLTPTSGTLAVGEALTVHIAFTPSQAVVLAVAVPVYIRGGKLRGERPYLTLMLHATALFPRLTFDRAEVILPPVPLGHTAKASFYVINEGYDNLQIKSKLPVDTARAPLQLSFPEGNLVGISKQKLLVTVSFAAKKPMSFTAKVELLDAEGNRFAIPVTGTTDNTSMEPPQI